jgi:hypothetical protein
MALCQAVHQSDSFVACIHNLTRSSFLHPQAPAVVGVNSSS